MTPKLIFPVWGLLKEKVAEVEKKHFRYGPRRKAFHSLVGLNKRRTVEVLSAHGLVDPVWRAAPLEKLVRGQLARFRGPSGSLEDGLWVVDGFLPDGAGVFATRQP